MTICFLQNFINLMSLIRNKKNKGNCNIKIKLIYLKYTSKDFYLFLTLTFFLNIFAFLLIIFFLIVKGTS